MPRAKLGRSRPTTAGAAPATSRIVRLEVVGCEQMAVAADTRYGHGLKNPLRRKAHALSFGCSKARPPLPISTVCAVVNRMPRRAASLAVSRLPLRERVENSHTCGREVVDVPRDNHKIVNQCGRRNLLVQRIFGVRHTKPTPDVGHILI
jgi:hypothetical protein